MFDLKPPACFAVTLAQKFYLASKKNSSFGPRWLVFWSFVNILVSSFYTQSLLYDQFFSKNRPNYRFHFCYQSLSLQLHNLKLSRIKFQPRSEKEQSNDYDDVSFRDQYIYKRREHI